MSTRPGANSGNGWERPQTKGDYITDRAIRVVLWLALRLPYRLRVSVFGWLFRRVLGPVLGLERRASDNVSLIWPELDRSQVRHIARASLDNMGRTFIENFSTVEFLQRADSFDMGGPGLQAFCDAQNAGRPVILATGHYGNYEAPRAALCQKGWQVGGIYRPMNNARFNEYYVTTMSHFGGPVVPRGTSGMRTLMKRLRDGGAMVMLFDQYMREGIEVPFLGRPSLTMTTAADLALKYDAVLIPFFGIRSEDGLGFHAHFAAPVKLTTTEDTTRALNDALSAQIEAVPDQWFWVHRRWKVRRQRTRRTASTGPGPSD